MLGGGIAAALLWSLDMTIIKKEDRHSAAQKWVPVYVGLMAGAFSSYLIMKGLKQIIHVETSVAYLTGVIFAL